MSYFLTVFELALIGLAAGFLGGMLGVGGSVIMIPAMTEVMGPDQHLYQATAMIVNLCVVLPALHQHRQAGAIVSPVVRRMIPLATIAVIVGVAASELRVFSGQGEAYLRGLFGAFILILGLYDLYRIFRQWRREIAAKAALRDGPSSIPAIEPSAEEVYPAGAFGWLRLAAVSVPTGLVGGLFGVGGGIVSVPLQRRLLRMPMRRAIANSAAVMLATSLVGAVTKNLAYASEHGSYLQPLLLAAVLAPVAIVGSYKGSALTHRLPLKTVKIAFFILLILGALRIIQGAWSSIATG